MAISRYQDKRGIIQNIGRVDRSGMFQARAQAASAIGRVAEGVGNAAFNIASQTAELAGQQAGVRDSVQFDANGRLMPLSKLPSDLSIYSQAYRKSAITNYVSAASDDARIAAGELARKFQNDPEGFRENWNTHMETTLGAMDEEARAYVSADMHRVGATQFGAIADAKAQVDLENAVAGLDGQVQTIYGELYSRVKSIGADAPRTLAEIQAVMPQLDALFEQYKGVTGGRVGDADIAEQKRKFQVGIFEAMISNEAVKRGSAMRTIDGVTVPDTDGALAYLEELRTNKPDYAAGATPEEWDGIINRAKADVGASAATHAQAIDQQRLNLNMAAMQSRLEMGAAIQTAVFNNDLAALTELERKIQRGEGLSGAPSDVMQARLGLGAQVFQSRAQLIAEQEVAELTRQGGELQRELDRAVAANDRKAQREVERKIMALRGKHINPAQVESERQQLLSRLQAGQMEVQARLAEQQELVSFATDKMQGGVPLERNEADALVGSMLGLGKKFGRGERAAQDTAWINPTTPDFAGKGIDLINQMGQVPTPHLDAFQSILGGAMTPTAFQQGSPDPGQIISTAQNFITLDTGGNAAVQQQIRSLPGYDALREFSNIVTQEVAYQPEQDHSKLIAQARGVVSKNKAARISMFSEAYKAAGNEGLRGMAQSAMQYSLDQGNWLSQVGRSLSAFGGTLSDIPDNIGAKMGKIMPGGIVDLAKQYGLGIFVDDPAEHPLDEPGLGGASGDLGRNLQSIIPGWTPEADDLDWESLSSEAWAVMDGIVKGAAMEVGASADDVVNPSPALQKAIAERMSRVFGVSSVGNPDHAARMTFLAPERMTGMDSAALLDAVKGDLPKFGDVAKILGVDASELHSWVDTGNVWIEVDEGAYRRGKMQFHLMARTDQGVQVDLTTLPRSIGLGWDPRNSPAGDRVRRRDYWSQRKSVEQAQRMGLPPASQETMGKAGRALDATIDWMTPEIFRNDPPPVPNNAR
jgi:hypothetical protein